MLNRIIDLSLDFRWVVLLGAGLIAALGVASFTQLPFDAYPDTTPVQVTVNAVAPALSPLEIERQLTAKGRKAPRLKEEKGPEDASPSGPM